MSASNQPRNVILSSAEDWAADGLDRVAARPPASLSDHMMMALNPKVRLLLGPQKPLQQVINCAISSHSAVWWGAVHAADHHKQSRPCSCYNIIWILGNAAKLSGFCRILTRFDCTQKQRDWNFFLFVLLRGTFHLHSGWLSKSGKGEWCCISKLTV